MPELVVGAIGMAVAPAMPGMVLLSFDPALQGEKEAMPGESIRLGMRAKAPMRTRTGFIVEPVVMWALRTRKIEKCEEDPAVVADHDLFALVRSRSGAVLSHAMTAPRMKDGRIFLGIYEFEKLPYDIRKDAQLSDVLTERSLLALVGQR